MITVKLFLFLIYILTLNIKIIDGHQCQRDSLLTNDQQSVDFWVTIKLPGFMDLYLYHDSLMDSPMFLVRLKIDLFLVQGRFLRSKFSGFGMTLDQINEDESSDFLAYNNNFNKKWSFQTISGPDDKYWSMTHEKGMISWGKNDGFWLQHSLPKFPNLKGNKNENGFVKIDHFDLIEDVPDYLVDTLEFLEFAYKGLPPNHIFDSNLRSKSGSPCPNLDIFKKEKMSLLSDILKEFQLRPSWDYKTVDLNYLFMDIPRADSFAQHIVCVSLSSIQKVDQMIEYLSYLNPDIDRGTVASRSGSKRFKKIDKIVATTQTIQATDNFKFHLSVQPFTHQIGSIWNNLFKEECKTQPCLPFPEKGKSSDLTISTWTTADAQFGFQKQLVKLAKFKTTYEVLTKTQEFKWGAGYGSEMDHSKLAYLPPGEKYKDWNVCFGGENMYCSKSACYGSLLFCFKSDNLAGAFRSIEDDIENSGPFQMEVNGKTKNIGFNADKNALNGNSFDRYRKSSGSIAANSLFHLSFNQWKRHRTKPTKGGEEYFIKNNNFIEDILLHFFGPNSNVQIQVDIIKEKKNPPSTPTKTNSKRSLENGYNINSVDSHDLKRKKHEPLVEYDCGDQESQDPRDTDSEPIFNIIKIEKNELPLANYICQKIANDPNNNNNKNKK
ncbi:hypothetical protein PPL_08833 [Heterostelium album PN500]|uniref:Uncharacterized protein n=1 Tax=Heterostelium pallidum (strain ATCC 26659 / Pp 5 / PN500) TaxID=670386 RepID=D3BJV3_HETP5|nr:hypothetical protein PPL_08833 [Heterostelium album PN500]EFA78183.1 hypothetical protein PPL_08833 [Heterostelium album PN500]|eukprot:XP_020430309.1 hypothetical protein PPL_08833 [Heterostelium album PN500]